MICPTFKKYVLLFDEFDLFFHKLVYTKDVNFIVNQTKTSSYSYAGINLTGYHPAPGTPGLLHRNVCPAPGLLHNRKCPGAGPIKDDVPGAGHLYQLAFQT